MTTLLQYRRLDGLITGIWRASPGPLLAAQMVEGDPLTGYAVSETVDTLAPELVQDRYAVFNETAYPKMQLVLTPDVLTFAADGVAACTISVVPFLACSVRVNGGSPVALTGGDPTVVLTADMPEVFTVTLVPLAEAWAEALQVEAV